MIPFGQMKWTQFWKLQEITLWNPFCVNSGIYEQKCISYRDTQSWSTLQNEKHELHRVTWLIKFGGWSLSRKRPRSKQMNSHLLQVKKSWGRKKEEAQVVQEVLLFFIFFLSFELNDDPGKVENSEKKEGCISVEADVLCVIYKRQEKNPNTVF